MAKTKAAVALTTRQLRVLQALAKGQPLTRKQLAGATGQKKGWSALLGAPTKGIKDGTMQGLGLVAVSKQQPYVYSITATGKASLPKTKSAKKLATA